MKQSKKEFCGSIFARMMEQYNERAASAIEESMSLSREEDEEAFVLPANMIVQGV